jgi:hypothetical protein
VVRFQAPTKAFLFPSHILDLKKIMDIDSSPGILPPSSNRTPFDSSQSRSPTQSRRTATTASRARTTARTTTNAISLGDEDDGNAMDDDGDDRPQAEEANGDRGQRSKGKRARMNLDVPPVRDATGEKVMESFEQFLKSWVAILLSLHSRNLIISMYLPQD